MRSGSLAGMMALVLTCGGPLLGSSSVALANYISFRGKPDRIGMVHVVRDSSKLGFQVQRTRFPRIRAEITCNVPGYRVFRLESVRPPRRTTKFTANVPTVFNDSLKCQNRYAGQLKLCRSWGSSLGAIRAACRAGKTMAIIPVASRGVCRKVKLAVGRTYHHVWSDTKALVNLRCDGYGVPKLSPLRLDYNPWLRKHYSNRTRGGIRSFRLVRLQGHVYVRPRPGTKPLFAYRNPTTGDYLTTAEAKPPHGYVLVHRIGFVLRNYAKGTRALKQYYHQGRRDHLSLTDKGQEQLAQREGYRFVRVEGYLIDP